ASITPAFTRSSLYFPIAASNSSLGITPASVSLLALIMTITRIVISPSNLVLGTRFPDRAARLNSRSICTSDEVLGNRHAEQLFFVARLRARNADRREHSRGKPLSGTRSRFGSLFFPVSRRRVRLKRVQQFSGGYYDLINCRQECDFVGF